MKPRPRSRPRTSRLCGEVNSLQAKSEIFIPNEAARVTGEGRLTLGLPLTVVKVAPAETIGVQVSVRLPLTRPSPRRRQVHPHRCQRTEVEYLSVMVSLTVKP